MQRATLREEKTKKEDEVKRDDNFGTAATIRTKWYFYSFFYFFGKLINKNILFSVDMMLQNSLYLRWVSILNFA